VKGLAYPYSSLFPRLTLFCDFQIFDGRFRSLHSANFFSPHLGGALAYPAPAAMVYALFDNVLPSFDKLLPRFHVEAFELVTMISVALLLLLLIKKMMHLGYETWKAGGLATGAAVLMFPFWFVWHQANIEIVLFLLLASGLIAFLRGRFWLAAVLIAVCVSMKLFPFILLALFLPLKRYKELVLAGIVFILSNLISLWVICPQIDIAWKGISYGLKASRENYMLVYLGRETPMDHSTYGFVKTLFLQVKHQQIFSSHSLTLCMTVMACLGLAIYFGRIRKLPWLNQIACLYICMLVLTPESFEYTLTHLAVVWALFVLYTMQRAKNLQDVQGMTKAFVCLAILLAPLGELNFHGVGYGGQVKCVVLYILLYIALTSRWEGFETAHWISPELRTFSRQG